MKYVYLLWNHDEYGPETTVATLNRMYVFQLYENTFGKCWWGDATKEQLDAWKKQCDSDRAKLVELLSKPDYELLTSEGGHALGSGWGGVHLQVLKLEG